MSDYKTILYQKQRKGVLITLNRPNALNAMNEEMMNELDRALAEAEPDPEIRAVVITGAGGAFSVGAVSGWCLGAGSWLALTCHVTIAADDAVFGQPEVRHGANTDFIWVALAGFKNALRYSLTGDHVDAQEALRIGLVNQVVPKDELLETCFKFVERIAHVPPETVKINLHISTQGLEMMGLRKAWMLNSELAAMARLSKREEFNKRLEDAKRKGGLEAFLKERDAPFQPEPFGPRAKR